LSVRLFQSRPDVFGAAEDGSPYLWVALSLLSIPALIVVNGLFVAAEFALVAVRKTRVEELVARGVKGAKAVEAAVRNLSRSIAGTQLGVTLSSIGLGFVGEPALAQLLDPEFYNLFGSWHNAATHTVATVLAFLLITFLHVVFGELIPKALALQNPDSASLWLARPLIVFARLTRPLVLMMSGLSSFILRRVGARPVDGEEAAHSIEELMLLIEDTEEAGVLDPDQADFVQNVFRLSNKHVRDCMAPRDKMAALELHTPPDKILEAVRNGAHTRMPVYDGKLDTIVGIVNTKDLFYLFSLQGVVVLLDALYPALYLKPDESLDNALRLFRRAKRPMALVRDEDDHILGLITLEDVLEEIVGDIEDEHDRPTARLRRRTKIKLSRPVPKPASSPPAKQAAPAPGLQAKAP
jgi:CBS domain containing-hemolysin-like protein